MGIGIIADNVAVVVGSEFIGTPRSEKSTLHISVTGGTITAKLRGGNIAGALADLSTDAATFTIADGASELINIDMPVGYIGFKVTAITGTPIVRAANCAAGL